MNVPEPLRRPGAPRSRVKASLRELEELRRLKAGLDEWGREFRRFRDALRRERARSEAAHSALDEWGLRLGLRLHGLRHPYSFPSGGSSALGSGGTQ